jgi:hypothetical protein
MEPRNFYFTFSYIDHIIIFNYLIDNLPENVNIYYDHVMNTKLVEFCHKIGNKLIYSCTLNLPDNYTTIHLNDLLENGWNYYLNKNQPDGRH